MSKEKIEEMRAAMRAFYSNATDEEFWDALKAADMGVYSKATLQEHWVNCPEYDLSITVVGGMARADAPSAFSGLRNGGLQKQAKPRKYRRIARRLGKL